MRPITLNYTPLATDTDNIAPASTAIVTATAMVLAAAWISGGYAMSDGLAHKITIDPSGSVSGNYVITGTDADGIAQSETLAANAGTAVTSTKYWLKVTSIVPSFTESDTVTIGYTDVCVTKTVPLNWKQGPPFSVGLLLDVTGTIDCTAQHTFENPLTDGAQPSTFTWMPHATIVTKTADTDSNYAYPCMATRMLVNSKGSNGAFKYQIVQGE